jgi:hypothetical protein
VRERIEYRFRVPSAAVFTLYSYSKALEYLFRVSTAGSLRPEHLAALLIYLFILRGRHLAAEVLFATLCVHIVAHVKPKKKAELAGYRPM